MIPEHRHGAEIRVLGRRLEGSALVYGDTAPDFQERFLPGSLAPVPSVGLNLQHDPGTVLLEPGSYELNDTERALEVRAELPAGSAALALTRRGALNSFSIEFHAKAERREAGIRVIEKATLTGIALVDRGAYPLSTAEIPGPWWRWRARCLRWKTRHVPRPGAGAKGSRLPVRSGRLRKRPIRARQFRQPAIGRRRARCAERCRRLLPRHRFRATRLYPILAFQGWRARIRGRRPQQFPRANVARYARRCRYLRAPRARHGDFEFTKVGTLARYSDARVRAMQFSATDANDGWDAIERVAESAGALADKAAALSGISRPARRRARVWL